MKFMPVAAAGLALCLSAPAFAHHSFAMEPLKLEGATGPTVAPIAVLW